MALLFGTSWAVNSIVVSGLLVLIVAGNGVAALRPLPTAVAFAGIGLSLLLAHAVSLETLFSASTVPRALDATMLLGLPVFFAAIAFIASFRAIGFKGAALGSNLLGALVGGLLESSSMALGMRAMVVLAALLYLAAYLTRP
jgi:hypothetical protein